MNKNEFYKELMKEYTFDSAKVRRSAKRSSFKVVSKRWWHIPSTVAVAAVSLTVGLFAFFQGGSNNGNNPTPPGEIYSTGTAIKAASSDLGTKTLFLSFNNSITYNEMQNTFELVSDTGNIVVEALYILDGDNEVTLVKLSEDFYESGDFDSFYDDSAQIIGAKVYAPATLIDDFRHQKDVAVVKIGMTDDDFVPYISEDELFEPEFEAPYYTEEEYEEPVFTNLPADYENSVSFNIPGIIEASFISDNKFIAFTGGAVTLYEISNDLEIIPVSEYALHNYKKRFSVTGKSILISGTDGDKSVLLVADAVTKSLESIDISKPVGSGELMNAFYDDINRRIVMRVKNKDANAIYIIDRDSFGILPVPSSSHDAVILALNGNSIYFSSNSSVYRFDISSGVSTDLYTTLGNAPSFERSADLSSFVINQNGESIVFTVKNESFSKAAEIPNGLEFYRNSSDLLTDGMNLYKVSEEGALERFEGQPTSPERQMVSELFRILEITAESVIVLVK
ncbi:MAG: hypothetical protein FWF94_02015 [Oscillospiraceae bacterium]|nr:hypothetical protein [Oscillospiraceae bacterium]